MVKTRVFVIIIVILLVVCVALTLFFFLRKPSGTVANVYVKGELVYSVDLSEVNEPFDKKIETENGYNILHVEKNKIKISEADCPDHTCVSTGHASGSTPIVCLPHELVVKIEKEGDTDATAR